MTEGLERRRKRVPEPDPDPEVAVSGSMVSRVLGPRRKPGGHFEQRPRRELQPLVRTAPSNRPSAAAGSVRAALEVDHRRHRFDARLLRQGGAGERPLHGHPPEVEKRFGIYLFCIKQSFFYYSSL